MVIRITMHYLPEASSIIAYRAFITMVTEKSHKNDKWNNLG